MSISPPFVLSSAREPNKYTCEFGAIFLSSDLIKNAMSFLRRTTVYFCFIFLTSVASAKEGSPLTTHFSSLTAPCLLLMLFSRKDAESQRASLRDSGCSKRLCIYYSFLAVLICRIRVICVPFLVCPVAKHSPLS